jgi:hypothetical protein
VEKFETSQRRYEPRGARIFFEKWTAENVVSKSSEEDDEAGELDKAEEVLSVVLPADQDATLPL